MALINNAVATSNSGLSTMSQVQCNVALPSVSNLASNGNAYMQIYQMQLGIGGNGASRTVALGIWNSSASAIAATAPFSVAAGSATLTGNKSFYASTLVNRTSTSSLYFGYWSSGAGSTYFQYDFSSQSTVDIEGDSTTSTSLTTFQSDSLLYSESSLVGTFDYYTVPSAPQSLAVIVGDTQVSVSWAAPADNGGTAITGYYVQYATNSAFTTGVSSLISVSGTSTTVTGLTNGTPYWFRVGARNQVTNAVSSTTSSAYVTTATSYTPASTSPPGLPTGLTLAQQTPQNPIGVLVSWTAPSGGATPTGYIINYSPNSDFSGSFSVRLPSTMTSFELNGLDESEQYYIRVLAFNANGNGSYTTPATISTYTNATGFMRKWDSTAGVWTVVV